MSQRVTTPSARSVTATKFWAFSLFFQNVQTRGLNLLFSGGLFIQLFFCQAAPLALDKYR